MASWSFLPQFSDAIKIISNQCVQAFLSIYDILLDYDEKAFEVKKSYDYAGGNIVNSHNLLANKTFGGRKAKLFTVIDFSMLPLFFQTCKIVP